MIVGYASTITSKSFNINHLHFSDAKIHLRIQLNRRDQQLFSEGKKLEFFFLISRKHTNNTNTISSFSGL
jgi:hypothetical protein